MRPIIMFSDATEIGDDGVAIAILTNAPIITVRLIVATSGNTWAEEVAENIRKLLANFQRTDIPVCVGRGSDTYDRRTALFNSRRDGGATIRYAGALRKPLPAPNPGIDATSTNCRAMIDGILRSGAHDLAIIAPASVIALMLLETPDIANRIGRIYMMGGALTVPGNATDKAEFNVWFDPEATESLLASTIPFTLLPLDALQGVSYPQGVLKSGSNSARAAYLAQHLKRRQGNAPQPMWDEVLASILIDPTVVVRSERLKLAVETEPGPYYGSLKILNANATRRPIDVVMQVDRQAINWILEATIVRKPNN